MDGAGSIPPMTFVWDGEAMAPTHARLADKHFVIGETYTLLEHSDRSDASHAHYFACLKTAWENLPEAGAERFPTPEHLRKYALIKAGYRDERSLACSSKAEALRLAAFVKPMDDFAIITVSEAMVTVHTAKSQKYRAMGKTVFQESKDAVLEIVAGLIGVDADKLAQAAA